MRKCFIVFIHAITLAADLFAQRSEVWMIGPMLHFNFGNKKMHTSFGMELSYWNYNHFPYSFDGGIEFERHRVRLYGEAQTGIAIAGISIGPVLEIRTDEPDILLGLQRSIWINYFAGIDFRFRNIGGSKYFCPGVYGKLPFGYGEVSDGDDHHWDWDD